MNENPYMTLAKFILPSEMTDYFDLIKVKLDQFGEEQRLHLYLDEKDIKPKDKPSAMPNGFYEESCINDFPIREYRTVLRLLNLSISKIGIPLKIPTCKYNGFKFDVYDNK